MSRRESETTSLKSAFKHLLSEYKLEDKYREKQLIANWARLMGKPIALRTEKIYFREKKLFVHLNSSPLKSELDHSKAKVIEILHREFGSDLFEELVFL